MRYCEAGHADEQAVAIGVERGDKPADDAMLADNHFREFSHDRAGNAGHVVDVSHGAVVLISQMRLQ